MLGGGGGLGWIDHRWDLKWGSHRNHGRCLSTENLVFIYIYIYILKSCLIDYCYLVCLNVFFVPISPMVSIDQMGFNLG